MLEGVKRKLRVYRCNDPAVYYPGRGERGNNTKKKCITLRKMHPLRPPPRIRTCYYSPLYWCKNRVFSLVKHYRRTIRSFCASLRTSLRTAGLQCIIRLLPVGRPAVGERVSARACVRTYEILYACLEREPNRVRSYVWRRRRLSMLNSRRRIFSLGRVAAWQWSRPLFVYRGKKLYENKKTAHAPSAGVRRRVLYTP